MQYVFFRQRYTQFTMGLGQSPRSWGNFRDFCVKSNLSICKVTFNCKLQKKIGEHYVLVAPPNNFVVGATAGVEC